MAKILWLLWLDRSLAQNTKNAQADEVGGLISHFGIFKQSW